MITLKKAIETKAKLAYQKFYNEYKHAFCLGSWEQLTESQKHYYKMKGLDNIPKG
jgi:hypothetical protein